MRARTHRRRSPAGFSLVELMIVLAIMLLLAALALPRLLDAQRKAYEAAVVSFIRTLQTNQESYRLANGSYADNFNDLSLTARGPAIPGDLFTPDEMQRLALRFPDLGPFTVLAAQPGQQPPAKPPEPGQGFGNEPGKKPPEKASGPGGTPSGTGGGGAPAPGGSSNPTSGGGTSGGTGGAGGSSGGGTSGGGSTSGGSSGQPGSSGGSGGLGGSSSSGGGQKTNIVLKHNYIFTLLRPTLTTWTCTVAPIRDRGDSIFFYVDQTGVIRAELGKSATVASPQM